MGNEASNPAFWTMPCIFCDTILGPKTKPEHILLDALGGRKTTRVAICSACNQTFGSSIDRAMPEQLKVLRNMFQMRSGSGDLPPALQQMDTANGKIGFAKDGRPKPARGAPFTVEALGEGRWNVSFDLANEEELRRFVPHAAAQMGMTEDRLWDQIQGRTATRRTDYVGVIHARFHCDGEEVIRSITKSALVLLAIRTGTQVLRGPALAAARDFVVNGSQAFHAEHTTSDARPLPSPAYDHLLATYGPMFNLIYVKSNAWGRVVAYFYLFNLQAWQIVLAPEGGPANVEIALASNPLDTLCWSDEVAAAAPLDFDWLDNPDNSARNETAMKRFSAILELRQDIDRKRTIRSTLDQVLGDPERETTQDKTRGEGTPLMADRLDRVAIQALSEKLTIALMQIPTTEEFTISRFPSSPEPDPRQED